MAEAKSKKTKSELSKTDTQIVVIVLILLITIAIGVVEYMYWFTPKTEEIEKAQQTLSGLQTKVEEAKRVPSQIQYYQEQIDILEGKGDSSEEGDADDTELRQEIDVPTILAIVENAATSTNMKLTSIAMDGNAAYIKGGIISGTPSDTPQPDTSGQGGMGQDTSTPVPDNSSSFYKLGIAMEVSSVSYSDLMKFLENVENAGYYITTASASLNTSDGNIYQGNLTFYIYSLVASSK